ncbi:MAG TPA: HlyD family secretion protein [Coleofasciculaceae cyanobacterium]
MKSPLINETDRNGTSPATATPPVVSTLEPIEAPATDRPITPPAETPITATADPTPDLAPKKRHPIGLAIVVVLVAAGAIAGGRWAWQFWHYASTHEETDNAQVAGHLYPVASRVPGTVTAVAVEDNQHVAAGAVLVRLDPTDYQVKVQQSQAALVAAQQDARAAQSSIALAGANTAAQLTTARGDLGDATAAIADAQAALDEAAAGVPVARANLAQAQAALTKAKADYARYDALYQDGAIAAQQRDAAKAAYDVAIAQTAAARQQVQQAIARVERARQGIDRAKATRQSRQGDVQQARATGGQTQVNRDRYAAATAQIARQAADLRAAQLQLSYTTIAAPVSGRIGRKTVEVGAQVQAGQPLMAIVGDQLWIEANFKETQVQRMHPGEAVEIRLDAFPDHPFHGHVESLAPASGAQFALLPPDNATGNFTKVVQRIPVRIAIDPDSLRGYETQVAPGMSANVSVTVR